MVTLIHWAAFALGVLLWSLPFVLYQDEEARLRNKLVDWWVAVTRSGEAVVGKHVVFTRALAAQTLKATSMFFGEKRFGIQAIWANVMLSSAAFYTWIALYDHGLGRFVRSPNLSGYNSRHWALQAVLALSLGLLPGAIRRQKRPGVRRAGWAVLAIYCVYQASSWLFQGYVGELSAPPRWYRNIFAAYIVSVVYGLLMVELLRRVLAKAVGPTRWSVAIIGTLVSMPVLILGVPYLVIRLVTRGEGLTPTGLHYAYDRWMGVIGAAVFSIPLNSTWLVVSFGLVVAVALLAINAVFWALTARTLNALYAKLPGRATLIATGAFFWLAFLTSFSESFKHLIHAR